MKNAFYVFSFRSQDIQIFVLTFLKIFDGSIRKARLILKSITSQPC